MSDLPASEVIGLVGLSHTQRVGCLTILSLHPRHTLRSIVAFISQHIMLKHARLRKTSWSAACCSPPQIAVNWC